VACEFIGLWHRLALMNESPTILIAEDDTDVALAVEALKRGAVDFILKPWANDKLIAAVAAAATITWMRRRAETPALDTLECNAIERTLARHGGNISLAAASLGLSRPALYRRMVKYGL
jgi:two-component system response regulator RegA